jgi:hypothetical protein
MIKHGERQLDALKRQSKINKDKAVFIFLLLLLVLPERRDDDILTGFAVGQIGEDPRR